MHMPTHPSEKASFMDRPRRRGRKVRPADCYAMATAIPFDALKKGHLLASESGNSTVARRRSPTSRLARSRDKFIRV
jgi:hypothetical protein